MELIYTTNDVDVANKLSARLTASRISNFVTGNETHHAYVGGRHPSSICVWIDDAEDLDRAYNVMIKIGYAFPPSDEPRPNLKHNRALVVILATIFMLLVGVAIVGVP